MVIKLNFNVLFYEVFQESIGFVNWDKCQSILLWESRKKKQKSKKSRCCWNRIEHVGVVQEFLNTSIIGITQKDNTWWPEIMIYCNVDEKKLVRSKILLTYISAILILYFLNNISTFNVLFLWTSIQIATKNKWLQNF